MAVEIPAAYLDLLTGTVVVGLTTVMPDGQPQSTPVWVDSDGTNILVNTARGRIKDRNMQRSAKVTILAIDPKNPYRWMEIRGQVTDATEEGAVDLIDKLSWRYYGHGFYEGANAERKNTETRVTYTIAPIHVIARG